MSRLRDIARDARSGIEELLGRLASGTEELAHVQADELEAELEARKAAGAREPKKNPRAMHADGSEASRQTRSKAAEVREARVRAERERHEKADRAAQEAAFRRAQEQAARQADAEYERFRSSAGSGGGPRSKGVRSPFGQDPKLAKHYQTLHLPYGAEFAEVKAAYRKLMRKYHPDLHNQSAKKQKAATELTVQVTQAYNELDKHLNKK